VIYGHLGNPRLQTKVRDHDQNHLLGNTKFLTKKLWGFANSGPFMHHGKFTTIREAVLAHAGEALFSRMEFQALSPHEQRCIIEFLKSLHSPAAWHQGIRNYLSSRKLS
jgi:CxxC motif-containing protein (DUF1111 family)